MLRPALVLAAALATATALAAPARAESPVDGPWIGISYAAGRDGLVVLEVHDDTAASDAGLRRGDEIVELAGVTVQPGTDLPSMVAHARVGDRLPVTILRDGARIAVVAVLGARPSDGELLHRRLVDKAAPPLDVVPVGARAHIDLGALRGRVAVLAFFSTRCDGCADGLNQVGALLRQRAPRASVLAISADAGDPLDVFLQRFPLTVPVAADDTGETWRRYTVPTSEPRLILAVVDHRGEVRYAAVVAPSDREALAEMALAAARADKARARAPLGR